MCSFISSLLTQPEHHQLLRFPDRTFFRGSLENGDSGALLHCFPQHWKTVAALHHILSACGAYSSGSNERHLAIKGRELRNETIKRTPRMLHENTVYA